MLLLCADAIKPWSFNPSPSDLTYTTSLPGGGPGTQQQRSRGRVGPAPPHSLVEGPGHSSRGRVDYASSKPLPKPGCFSPLIPIRVIVSPGVGGTASRPQTLPQWRLSAVSCCGRDGKALGVQVCLWALRMLDMGVHVGPWGFRIQACFPRSVWRQTPGRGKRALARNVWKGVKHVSSVGPMWDNSLSVAASDGPLDSSSARS